MSCLFHSSLFAFWLSSPPSLLSDFSFPFSFLSPPMQFCFRANKMHWTWGKGGDIASSMLFSLFFLSFRLWFSYFLSLPHPFGSFNWNFLNKNKGILTYSHNKTTMKKRRWRSLTNNWVGLQIFRSYLQSGDRKVPIMSQLFCFPHHPVLSRASTLNLFCSVEACSARVSYRTEDMTRFCLSCHFPWHCIWMSLISCCLFHHLKPAY